MSFKKLALVTAMFAATTGAYAMEAMDDESMSAATGQDGITVTISAVNDITMNQIIHDKDGYAGAATPQGGAIVIGDVGGTTTGRKGMTVDFSGLDGSYATAADNVDVSLIIDADGGDATGSTP
ncbi:MAG TPA: pilus assembly protein FilA, partial [Moraxellaceae bacterium]|nr:pilus assembly protein FilA [Moraxellaceae bacterium]